jgi:CRP/FNR family transcriptional regulator, cyclic AMP receptor protein
MNVRVAQPRNEFVGLEEETEFLPLAPGLGTVRDYAAGEFIFREGDPPRYMYVVLKGEVEVMADERVAGTIHEGQALGILSLLDVSPRLTAARAAGPCKLALLDEKRFRALTEREPNFIVFVMQELGSRANL